MAQSQIFPGEDYYLNCPPSRTPDATWLYHPRFSGIRYESLAMLKPTDDDHASRFHPVAFSYSIKRGIFTNIAHPSPALQTDPYRRVVGDAVPVAHDLLSIPWPVKSIYTPAHHAILGTKHSEQTVHEAAGGPRCRNR